MFFVTKELHFSTSYKLEINHLYK